MPLLISAPTSPILYLKSAQVIPLHPSPGAPLPTIGKWSATSTEEVTRRAVVWTKFGRRC